MDSKSEELSHMGTDTVDGEADSKVLNRGWVRSRSSSTLSPTVFVPSITRRLPGRGEWSGRTSCHSISEASL